MPVRRLSRIPKWISVAGALLALVTGMIWLHQRSIERVRENGLKRALVMVQSAIDRYR